MGKIERYIEAISKYLNGNQKGLLKEPKYRKDIKKPVIIIGLVVLSIIILSFTYKHYKAIAFNKMIIAPNAITVRNKFNAPLIAGTGIFEGQIQIIDKDVIENIINMIKEGKNLKSYSANEANNFNTNNISFSIGTIVYSSEIPENTLTTVNIFKDGTFIAGKKKSLNEYAYIKGKLEKGALKYLKNEYERSKREK